ncbi:PAS-domain containing protein [Rhodobacteraceae bacterium D3-12]|nr:PAS-domain containing protein [Rhodobacteraceae bacterium D3-12]
MNVLTILGLASICLAVAFATLWLISQLDRRYNSHLTPRGDGVFYLFDGDDLVDATGEGMDVLREVGSRNPLLWHHMRRALVLRFPGLPRDAKAAAAIAPTELPTDKENDPAVVTLTLSNGKLRVGIKDPSPASVADRHLRIQHGRMLRRVGKATNLYPYPLWVLSDRGELDWSNTAYRDLRAKTDPNSPDSKIQSFEFSESLDSGTENKRIMVQPQNTTDAIWYNVTRTKSEDGANLNFATNIDAVINAEIAQRKFVQTLTKTFAQLSAGLAIFDRDRELALFNPALIDLLGLSAEFLSAQPTLVSFFDRLRDTRMMPEPKDYANWRQQITDLVIASVDGRFQETWTLPSGLTYRVTGRPHPDGAIALLFEDISAEISLTRRFRTQLSLGQAVIDTLDEAIVVFSASGTLTSSNKTYRELWMFDPDKSFADVTIRDALRHWQSTAGNDPFWHRLRDYLADSTDRSERFADITMKTGTPLECRVTPLAGGATLVGFRLRPVIGPPRQVQREQSEPH